MQLHRKSMQLHHFHLIILGKMQLHRKDMQLHRFCMQLHHRPFFDPFFTISKTYTSTRDKHPGCARIRLQTMDSPD